MVPIEHFEGHSASKIPILIDVFDEVDYQHSATAMAEFASTREDQSQDRIWLLQHPPVYTQGTACQQNTLQPSDIDVVKSDRGGQITYHGPGQIVMYPMLKLKRFDLGVKALVQRLEEAVIKLLQSYDIKAERRTDAPGVYVQQAKIAALGLRIRKGTSYHGLSLNIDMDLQPFKNIDPCGYQGLQVTQLANYVDGVDAKLIGRQLLRHFLALI